MNSREAVREVFARRATGAHGVMWTGKPSEETVPIFAKAYGVAPTQEAIFQYLGDDCRHIRADDGYKHPEGRRAFDPSYGITRNSLSAPGCFAEAETIADIEKYPWPDVKYFDFTDIYKKIDALPDKMIFTGMWCSFFTLIAHFFGMENYFIKMYEAPEVVEAVTEHIIDFYVAANEMFLEGLGDRADSILMGNDLGTQIDLFISPDLFRQFVLPSLKRLNAVGKKYNKTCIMHSCGSIYRIIPDLIEAGVEVLHPLQAQAAHMDAASLAKYKNDIAFLGGIDAQSFIVNATPAQVKDEVRRVRDILGPNIVISPSHESVLPNVPPENILALAEAARE